MEYRLVSSTSLCFFPVSTVMNQFPITSSWQYCRLHLAFQYPRKALCAVLIRLLNTYQAYRSSSFGLLVDVTVLNFSNMHPDERPRMNSPSGYRPLVPCVMMLHNGFHQF